MALPVCFPAPQPPAPLDFRLPYGLTFRTLPNALGQIPTADELVMKLLGQVSPILSPLMAVASLAKLGITIVDCFSSVIRAFSSLSPQPVIDCLKDLQAIMPLILAAVPPFNLIPPLRDAIHVFILLLDAVATQLRGLATARRRITNGRNLANSLNDDRLAQIIDCAELDMVASRSNMNNALAGVSLLLGSVATLIGLLGIPGDAPRKTAQLITSVRTFSTPDSIAGLNEEDLIQLLAPVVSVLREIDRALSLVA